MDSKMAISCRERLERGSRSLEAAQKAERLQLPAKRQSSIGILGHIRAVHAIDAIRAKDSLLPCAALLHPSQFLISHFDCPDLQNFWPAHGVVRHDFL